MCAPAMLFSIVVLLTMVVRCSRSVGLSLEASGPPCGGVGAAIGPGLPGRMVFVVLPGPRSPGCLDASVGVGRLTAGSRDGDAAGLGRIRVVPRLPEVVSLRAIAGCGFNAGEAAGLLPGETTAGGLESLPCGFSAGVVPGCFTMGDADGPFPSSPVVRRPGLTSL